MSLLFLLIVGYTSPQEIDLVAIEDTLFIAMETSNQVELYRFESTSLITELELEGNYNNVSIGYSSETVEPYVLLVCSYMLGMKGEQDTLFAFNPTDLSIKWKTGNLPCPQYVDPYMQSRFIDRWIFPTRDPRLLGYYCTHVTDATDDQLISSYAFDPDTSPTVWTDFLYRDMSINGWIGDYFHGPVFVGEEPPVTSVLNEESYWSGPSTWWVEFQVHEPASDSLMRFLPIASGNWSEPPPSYPAAYVLGSCSDCALLFWSNTEGTVFSTKLSGSPLEIIVTDTVEFSFPTNDWMGLAASRHPEDSGVLISYYYGGYIWARYLEDSWFTDEYQIAPSGNVFSGNIAVCSTPNGYWITWNDGNDYPNIAWVGRNTWTGISDDESSNTVQMNLTTEPNPFHGMCELSLYPCDTATPIHIYDASGRHVHSGSTDTNGNFVWFAELMPSGLYLIQAFNDDYCTSEKVLLIQ